MRGRRHRPRPPIKVHRGGDHPPASPATVAPSTLAVLIWLPSITQATPKGPKGLVARAVFGLWDRAQWPCVRDPSEPITAHHVAVFAGRRVAARLTKGHWGQGRVRVEAGVRELLRRPDRSPLRLAADQDTRAGSAVVTLRCSPYLGKDVRTGSETVCRSRQWRL
jgi:hypothetical protein